MVVVHDASLRLPSAHDSGARADHGGALSRPRALLAARVRRLLRRDVLFGAQVRLQAREGDDRGLRPAASPPLHAVHLHDHGDVAVVRASLDVRARPGRRA